MSERPGSAVSERTRERSEPGSAVSQPLQLPTVDDTRAFGARLARVLRAGDLVVLAGPLGAGKTALVQGLAHTGRLVTRPDSRSILPCHQLRAGRID